MWLIGLVLVATDAAPTPAGAPGSVPAEVESEEGTGEDVERIVVQGEERERETVQPIVELHGEELDNVRGVSLGEALQFLPGLSAIRTGSVYVPIIHGFFASRVALFNDDVRHYSQNWGLDHAPELDPFGAESIRVVKGAAGVRYGPEAIGGAILVAPHDYPEFDGIEGETFMSAETNGRAGNGALRVRGVMPTIPELAFRARVSTRQAADLETPNYVLDNTDVRELNGAAGVAWQSEHWSLEVDWERFDTTIGTFTGASSASSNLGSFQAALDSPEPRDAALYDIERNVNRPSQEVVHTTTKGRFRFDVGDRDEVTVTLSRQDDDREEFALVRDTIEGPQQVFSLETTRVDVLHERLAIKLDSGETLRLTSGLSGMSQDNATGGTDRRVIPAYDALELSAFTYGEFDMGEFRFELGGRYDLRTIEVFEPESESFDAAIVSEDFTFQAGSVTLGTVWQPSRSFELHFDLSSATRPPSALEQFTDGRVPGLPALVRGDRELGVETAWNASLGGGVRFPWGRFQLTTYATYVNDYIYFAPLIRDGEPLVSLTIRGALPVFNYRQVNALLVGGEASSSIGLGRYVTWDASGSYVQGRNTEDGEFLLFIPPARVQNTLKFSLPWEGTFYDSFVSATSAYVFRQRDFEESTDFSPPPDGFHLLSLAAGTRVDLGDQTLRLNAAVENATNTLYRNYPSLIRYFADEPGISVNLRAALEFSI
ncbi:MAG: TonB-dependent receptor [Myxococcota bacterium]